jgi:hypothetical protein
MRIGWILAACALACGCGSVPIVDQAPVPPSPQPVPIGIASRMLMLDRVVFDIPKGTVIGEFRRGRACIAPEDLIWGAEPPRTLSEGPYHTEFASVITAYGFSGPERPKSLFAQPTLTDDALVIAARVPSIKENRCSGVDVDFFWGSRRPVYKGSVRFVVHWEVFSVAEQRVVLALPTEGSAIGEDFKAPNEQNYYARAFGNALRVLLTRDEFRRLVGRPPV